MGNDLIGKPIKWCWKDVFKLLLITFLFVPFFLEFLMHDFLYSLFQNSLYSGTLTGFVMAIVFMTSLYYIILKPYHLSWKSVGVRRFSNQYWKWIIVWLCLLIIMSVVILIIMELLHISWENGKTESLQKNITWFTLLIGFVSAVIISPIYEEIFYRGFLYKWFRGKWGIAAGMVISSFIFMLVHIPTYNTLPVNFISGLVFAWTYEKTGSILPAIIIHSTFNGLALILTVTA
ncbi:MULTISPECIES: CPBP family intramembrane glutamic endopeptidase [Bacillaceae]|uniref:CPBP family intramembrane glutamic endopeptidase n=1 Tax=Bacillaceae TaxID=186817 RepID=UPI000686159D|nr:MULTISPECIES: type II CAAX endopeptidase family protein [Bacillaceae]UOE94428.1 CPBP family intramembrane metalloprotease [Alkalihalobacillus sp. LMS39]